LLKIENITSILQSLTLELRKKTRTVVKPYYVHLEAYKHKDIKVP
jgi:hypothetical protein